MIGDAAGAENQELCKDQGIDCDRVSIGLCSDGPIWIKTGSIFDWDLNQQKWGYNGIEDIPV